MWIHLKKVYKLGKVLQFTAGQRLAACLRNKMASMGGSSKGAMDLASKCIFRGFEAGGG